MSKQKINSLWGGVLLLTGTAIGGGLLALPISTSRAGFISALLLTVACWLLMTTSAFLMLEVNLSLPAKSNIVSMAKTLLGPWGAATAWISYLMLMYAIIAAYIAGGSDFLHNIFTHTFQTELGYGTYAILFTLPLSAIVYSGIRYVDYVNRGLMVIKLAIYLLLVLAILPVISPAKLLEGGDLRFVAQGLTIIVSAFSYANIIPSLRTYFNDDILSLRKAILIGSTVPLVCYILWNACVMGLIPLEGEHGLIHLINAKHPTSGLMDQLSTCLQSQTLNLLAQSFGSVCILTTFLTCSLGLVDFLADGLPVSRLHPNKRTLLIYIATFCPPLTLTLFYPGLFIKALNYAGIYCLILFVLLPVLMAWQSRYNPHKSTALPSAYRFIGGKWVLIVLGITSSAGIMYGFYHTLIL